MAQVLWRLVEDATLDTLNDRSRGQYDIRLTRDEAFERFFADLPRTGVTALGGFTISVSIEAAPGPPPVEPQTLRVRYMGPRSRRRDWYIPSQRSSTAYPLWRPGVVFDPAQTRPDTDYVVLVRDQADRFHARWLKGSDVGSLPVALRGHMRNTHVGVAEIGAADWQAVETALDHPFSGSRIGSADGSPRRADPAARCGHLTRLDR
jgi:5-methylcytosine-specific restriction enzyme B